MAVSKIAVMALVGILAVPILLGYAFNLSEVTETDYKTDGEPVNVTPLLATSTGYTYSHADPYKLNALNSHSSSADTVSFPRYESFGNNKTTFQLKQQGIVTSSSLPGADPDLQRFSYVGTTFLMPYSTTNYLVTTISYNSNGTTATETVDNLISWFYDGDSSTLYYSYYYRWDYNIVNDTITSDNIDLSYSWGGSPFEISYYYSAILKNGENQNANWVDLSKGFHFANNNGVGGFNWRISLPDQTYSVLLTINLDSITDANYGCDLYIGGIALSLQKKTESGNVVWSLFEKYHYPMRKVTDLYYDSSRNDNTYQLSVKLEPTGIYNDENDQYYNPEIKMNYIGGWPAVFGKANTYISYTYDYPTSNGYVIPLEGGLNYIGITDTAYSGGYVPAGTVIDRSPTIRVDDALFRAFEYQVIESKTYSPAEFKNNPYTTITNINLYGDSLSFGGNTYNVDNAGNITLGNHKISVNNLVLKSVPVAVGYENRIGDTVISVSAEPSTITFNGLWGASIETKEQVATTYTKTEWTPGEFAWDGMDTSFLMVGLITSLGMFIALGIYASRSRASVWPLMLVCGGAAALFFIML